MSAGGDLGLTVLTAGGGPSSAGFSGLSLQSRAMEWQVYPLPTPHSSQKSQPVLGKWTGTTDANITSRIQEMQDMIGIKDTLQKIDLLIKENVKSQKFLKQNIQEI